jgi:glucans biosynthesis protein C
MPTAAFFEPNGRRTDLDWVRIGAFALLIFYHIGVFYAPGPTAVGAISPRPLPWLIVPMALVNPWRLLVLFIVAGAATRFLADKLRPRALLKARSVRLLIPLAFGVGVIVPPQCFVQVVERCGYSGNYWDFWRRYLSADQNICPIGQHLFVPTYNHLWFVAYLWVFTALLILVLLVAPSVLEKLQRLVERALAGGGFILWPVCWLGLAWGLLEHRLGLAYALAIYGPAFLLGYLTASSDTLWVRLEKARWRAFAGAVASYCLMIGLALVFLGTQFDWGAKMASARSSSSVMLHFLSSSVYGLDQWLWITVVFGFAYHSLRGRDGPIRRYLTDAIFPFYIIHQTTIEVVGHYLAKERQPLGMEATLLIGATIASCFVTYEVARRSRSLRPFFGLKASVARRSVSPQELRTVARGMPSDDTA